MTTAQQLGLVGNSVRVQALPTASAETFGQGNRYYTLIGQQEGYITGHTYHTVVANDVYSWEDVASTPDYNEIENIPVINQDLTASGFTPVANTYYRHTGATTDTFTQGVIYLYDTAYHKLGESGGGGGTTLNKYETTVDCATSNGLGVMYRILSNAKKISYINNKFGSSPTLFSLDTVGGFVHLSWIFQNGTKGFVSYTLYYNYNYNSLKLSENSCRKVTINNNGYTISETQKFATASENIFIITYENDTEIT